ncbi:MAG TPA: glycosyltransferase family 39 protein [Fimbriimonadaceae bacterium]|nr:glycosyltransferase family 39 protein [Fimbriimonadaceae bacterium]
MLGVLITLLFSVGAACFGRLLIRKLTSDLDPALAIGLAGLTGLGALGTLTLFVGLVPGGLSVAGASVIGLICMASAVLVLRGAKRPEIHFPKGAAALFVLGIAVALLFALVSVLAPADTVEWDSLAYHLAVPKIWLAAGQIQPITFIHHSNFPFAVDNLYIWGLLWGGEAGARAFTLAFEVFGILAVFGLARHVYGGLAGWWAALTWSTVPAVLWLSGTGYIDVQNGLYAGFGIVLAALYVREREVSLLWLSGVMLGLATGSKYTGLQTILAVGIVLLGALYLNRNDSERKLSLKPMLLAGGLALLIASPWYVKNVAWTGNPVYPFFYKQFGGKHWSEWQGQIYSAEQQSFGVGREPGGEKVEPQRIGHAILGLAYQPGRYINPGQTAGLGFPIGAIGFVVIGAMLLWLISGRTTPFESSSLATVLVSFAMWFVLSEQSRYIVALAVPLSVLAGGGVLRLRAGPFLAGAAVLQALISFYVVKDQRFDAQLQVETGQVTTDQYMSALTKFYEPAQYLNQNVKGGRVALYDEVFGFLLDVPYLWANPGHSNELGYEAMQTGDDLVAALQREGVTYVYVNLLPAGSDPNNPQFKRWLQTLGLQGSAQPYTLEEKAKLMPDLNWRAKVLLGEAIASHRLVLEKVFERPPRLIFRMGA